MLSLTKNGIYCAQGGFFIDATGRVDKNIVTHAHSDHASPGHQSYLASKHSVALLKARLGKKSNVQGLDYGESITLNGVRVSLHPAAHVFGSSQVRVEYKGEVWVVSGDYKLENDNLSGQFETVKCNTFISECTFGLPVYNWPDQYLVYDQINSWWKSNKSNGVTSLLFGYSLGKSQRIIKNIDHSIGPVYVHQTVHTMNEAIRLAGGGLPETRVIDVNTNVNSIKGNLIIAPPSITTGSLLREIGPVATAMASGWAMTGRNFGRSKVTKGFVLSDHADWNGLLTAAKETGAKKIITMHGYTEELTRYLNEIGLDSQVIDDLRH